MMKLQGIEAEAFRGFRDAQHMPLDADAVLVTGGNGVGKTSLVDAIMWALTGTLPHLTKWRRRQNEEVVVNRYREGDIARVELELLDGDGPVLVRRTGNSFATSLLLSRNGSRTTGEEAEIELAKLLGSRSPARLAESLEQWGVLRQDELRGVLNATPAELHSRLRELLGLAVLDDFESAATALHKGRKDAAAGARMRVNASRQEIKRLESDVAALAASIRDESWIASAHQAITHAADRHRQLIQLEIPATAGELDALRALLVDLRGAYDDLRRIQTERSALLAQLARLGDRPITELNPEERHAARLARAEVAASALRQAQDSLAAARRELDQQAALASAAIPLLSDICPVCRQPINHSDVERRLQEAIAPGVREPMAAAQKRVEDVQLANAALERELAAEQSADEAALAALNERKAIDQRLAELRDALSDRSYPTIRLVAVDGPAVGEERITAQLDALRELGQAVRSYLLVAEESKQGPALATGEQQLTEERTKVRFAAEELERLARLEGEAELLARAVREAGVTVTQESLTAVNPKFADVYQRLAPHPTFTVLGLDHEVYRNRGRTLPRLEDPLYQVSVNPGAVCSVGQLNVVALSYFLALALLAGERSLPFVVLDDPLQSLDDANVLGFADFCRHLQSERQILVTTHDYRFGGLLERKLTPRRPGRSTLILDFASWDRSGPVVRWHRRERNGQLEVLADQ